MAASYPASWIGGMAKSPRIGQPKPGKNRIVAAVVFIARLHFR
jgi:hypothetical protein